MVDPGRLAREFYRGERLLERTLVWGRPFICPFAPLAAWVPHRARALDIGCGNGLWLLGLAASGRIHQGIGCDRSAAALATARRAAERFARQHPEAGVRLDLRQTADSRSWPVGPFDMVSIVDVLHHIPPAAQKDFLLAAWAQVGQGGRLIYRDMAQRPAVFAAVNRLHDLLVARQWINCFPIEHAAALPQDAGATTLHRQQWRRGPYAHEMLVVERRA